MARDKRLYSNKGTGKRHLSVRAVRRQPPDNSKLTRALITFALQQAADEAEAEADDRRRRREGRDD